MMKNLRYVVVFATYCSVLLKPALTHSECDLSRVFRTPKDMSTVNMDHFEILERSNFDQPKEQNQETQNTNRENTPNACANAQIIMRFAGDEAQGQNYVNFVPPQCRRYLEKGSNLGVVHHHNFFYSGQPSVPTQPTTENYLHPYPPPVPYTFPSYYYFCNNGIPQYVPPNMKPVMYVPKTYSPRVAVEREMFPIESEEITPFLEDDRRITRILSRMHPKILPSTELTNDDVEMKPEIKSKREAKEIVDNVENDIKGEGIEKKEQIVSDETANIMKNKKNEEISNDIAEESLMKNIPKEKSSKVDAEEKSAQKHIETLVEEAVVTYKPEDGAGEPKLLVSYPVTSSNVKKNNSEDLPIVAIIGDSHRDKNIPFGKRFSHDEGDLTEIRGNPFEAKSILNVLLPQIFREFTKKLIEHSPALVWNPKYIMDETPIQRQAKVDVETPVYYYIPPSSNTETTNAHQDVPVAITVIEAPRNYKKVMMEKQGPQEYRNTANPSIYSENNALKSQNSHMMSHRSYQRVQSFNSYGEKLVPQVKCTVSFASSGNGYYSDPSKTICYEMPSTVNVVEVESKNHYAPSVNYQQHSGYSSFPRGRSNPDYPKIYKVVPKYNIVPKYNYGYHTLSGATLEPVPEENSEVQGLLMATRTGVEQSKSNSGNVCKHCGHKYNLYPNYVPQNEMCSSCARESRQPSEY